MACLIYVGGMAVLVSLAVAGAISMVEIIRELDLDEGLDAEDWPQRSYQRITSAGRID